MGTFYKTINKINELGDTLASNYDLLYIGLNPTVSINSTEITSFEVKLYFKYGSELLETGVLTIIFDILSSETTFTVYNLPFKTDEMKEYFTENNA